MHGESVLVCSRSGSAQSLSGYAANGWGREPSHKQARQGVKILEIAKQHKSEINAGYTHVSPNPLVAPREGVGRLPQVYNFTKSLPTAC
jgi:hypothetical protein